MQIKMTEDSTLPNKMEWMCHLNGCQLFSIISSYMQSMSLWYDLYKIQ